MQYLGDLGADFVVFKNDEKTVDEIRAMNPAGILVSPGPGVQQMPGRLTGSVWHCSSAAVWCTVWVAGRDRRCYMQLVSAGICGSCTHAASHQRSVSKAHPLYIH